MLEVLFEHQLLTLGVLLWLLCVMSIAGGFVGGTLAVARLKKKGYFDPPLGTPATTTAINKKPKKTGRWISAATTIVKNTITIMDDQSDFQFRLAAAENDELIAELLNRMFKRALGKE